MTDWPHFDRLSAAESDHHVRLKNRAVEFLLSQGFGVGDIEQEAPYKTGRTDIYASNADREVFVECETSFAQNASQLSKGGELPMRDGETVYVASGNSVHLAEQKAKMSGKIIGPFGVYYSDRKTRVTWVEFEKVAELPEV